jgi:hypothetical protein
MHDALAEGVIERAAALERDLDRLFLRQLLAGRGVLRQVAAGNVFDRDVTRFLGDRGLEDGRDMRVLELARERRLVHELHGVGPVEIGAVHDLRIQHLERHVPAGEGVEGKKDRARRALAENLPELKLA